MFALKANPRQMPRKKPINLLQPIFSVTAKKEQHFSKDKSKAALEYSGESRH